ncbi:flagellar hook-length control protein FliK [Oceanobacillus chungangensis]|uniref:Flagellar hook-length control protein-like C-terminal domain-containing protein n=1 Tax=Oceanobacillus chungangensis TaxID=1229152 RepID=A0A3D8PQ56_9BACI|nr:flagellar hook-length control protein FliK [Oceanobacillus chungangensis]RDW17832.1 hypothetical protein CWR45_10900 [Oceanobacillus chungangensis]
MNTLDMIFQHKQSANNMMSQHNTRNLSNGHDTFQNVLTNEHNTAESELPQALTNTSDLEIGSMFNLNKNELALIMRDQNKEGLKAVTSTKDFGVDIDSLKLWNEIKAEVKESMNLNNSLDNRLGQVDQLNSQDEPKTISTDLMDESISLFPEDKQENALSMPSTSTEDYGVENTSMSLGIEVLETDEQLDDYNLGNLHPASLVSRIRETAEQNDLVMENPNQNVEKTKIFENNLATAPQPRNSSSAVQEQLAKVYTDVQNLLSQVQSEKDIPKIAHKLLELLQQWSAIEKQNNKSSDPSAPQLIGKNDGSREQLIWKNLVEVFQKRQDIAAKQMYDMDSKVTTQDVIKWAAKSLENQSQSERVLNQTVEFMPATSMQKLEQHAIHVNRTLTSDLQSTTQEVMEKFQSIVKSSKFLTMPNGTNQLSITLNPDNLGEMRLRLIQIDGEMTVKIMVTTQATKEILESNINQLKHMFAPNQVVIEKQESMMQQNSEQMKESKEQQMNQKEESESNHQEHHEQRYADDEFESQFREMLMNEKV